MSYLLELNDKIAAAERTVAKVKSVLTEKVKETEKLKKLAWLCPKCEKYYPKESVTISSTEVTNLETVFTDAGYGDDDEIAEVTRLVTYSHCPVCGERVSQGKGIYLREKNRRKTNAWKEK